jgi:DUF1707 SHOCT-like domain
VTRASDAAREAVVGRLREAAAEGRLTVEELAERIDAAYAARTQEELEPLTADLPAAAPGASPAAVGEGMPVGTGGGAAPTLVLGILGGGDRRGRWRVPERMTVVNVLGGADLDLREATFAAQDVTITVNCFMGGAQITVPPHVNVVMEGIGIMGGYSGPGTRVAARLDASSPTVRVRGVAIWGGVSVDRKPLRGAP